MMMRHFRLPAPPTLIHRVLQSTSSKPPRPQPQPVFTKPAEAQELAAKVQALIHKHAGPDWTPDTPSPPGWRLTKKGKGIARTFRFKTFAKSIEFLNLVADEAKKARHHPEVRKPKSPYLFAAFGDVSGAVLKETWANSYRYTMVRWTTHDGDGISALDLELAETCDGIASELGETWPGPDMPAEEKARWPTQKARLERSRT